ncbi:hypothetical protein P154DRAFT_538054 [Amniculicola lignicola CBS 123094]|uniref:Uncharacterized protein n=1 Tax=Amniculicola lignicola CBS 123094 TaxID=1392246 RepID=A0A6A5W3D3_9PLEO|nr:hypothetical protein P154DRAFT_538054 [Amniculicola lignicola CBS 123094]
MNSRPSRSSSPSNSTQTTTQDTSISDQAPLQRSSSFNGRQHPTETPQTPTGIHQHTFSSSAAQEPQLSSSGQAAPLIIVTGSPARAERAEPVSRQSRSLVSRHRSRNSTSQPPRRLTTPYDRPIRARSQPREALLEPILAMSSAASSPGNTSTSGGASGSSSNPSYHLPYAPFPYPMPGNGRGGQGQQGSNTGSGK